MTLRFQVIDLLLLTLVVGLGCAVAQLERMSWNDGVFFSIALAIAFTTARECLQLNGAALGEVQLTPDQNFQRRVLVSGRLFAATLLVSLLAVRMLVWHDVIELPEDPAADWPVGARSREALLQLALLVCIADPTFPTIRLERSAWRTSIAALGVPILLALAVIVLTQVTLVHYLVYIAVKGMAAAEPPQFTRLTTSTEEASFAYSLIVQFTIVLLLFIGTQWLAIEWTRRRA